MKRENNSCCANSNPRWKNKKLSNAYLQLVRLEISLMDRGPHPKVLQIVKYGGPMNINIIYMHIYIYIESAYRWLRESVKLVNLLQPSWDHGPSLEINSFTRCISLLYLRWHMLNNSDSVCSILHARFRLICLATTILAVH